jgi:hypothetical protein
MQIDGLNLHIVNRVILINNMLMKQYMIDNHKTMENIVSNHMWFYHIIKIKIIL